VKVVSNQHHTQFLGLYFILFIFLTHVVLQIFISYEIQPWLEKIHKTSSISNSHNSVYLQNHRHSRTHMNIALGIFKRSVKPILDLHQ